MRSISNFLFQPSQQTNQPQTTLLLDLSPDLEVIKKSLRKKTRQYITGSLEAGLVVREGNPGDLPAFFDLIQQIGDVP